MPGGLSMKGSRSQGFTLVELLVVVSVMSLLMGIVLAALGAVRRQSRQVVGMGNLRNIVGGVTGYALDNDEYYPESVATIGTGANWNWQEPTMIIAFKKLSPQRHRSMSEYLGEYLDADAMYCPNAPRKHEYFERAWRAGDEWDNPDTPPLQDPVLGTYCFYWNYIGYLGEGGEVFVGPWDMSGGGGQSRLLVSDYFGYDHWRSRGAYGSCEKFAGARVAEATSVSSPYWSSKCSSRDTLQIKVYAGYTDGHVEHFAPSQAVPMKVSKSSDGSIPYPDIRGSGVFYLPENALE